jgi:hypothetical protein
MNYLATILFSALSVRWPVVGLISFLVAYTGMAGFFEELHILGQAVGAVRPDNIALVVSIVVLLRRPPVLRIPDNVALLMWIITAMVPVGVFFMSSTMYEFLANSWRVFCWAPLFFALSRLSEKEWHTLQDAIIVLLAINGLLTFYIIHTGNYDLYRRLGSIRLFSFDRQSGLAGLEFSAFESSRLMLPGTCDFGSITVFLCFIRILASRIPPVRRVFYLALQMCTVYAMYFTLVRTAVAAVFIGVTVMLSSVVLRTQARQKVYVFGSILAVLLGIVVIVGHYSPTGTHWNERISGSADSYYTGHMRIENNIMYLRILSDSYAIIGHPGFEKADYIVGGYNDVVTVVAMWWYYGLIAAICYSLIMIYFAWRLLKVLKSSTPHGIISFYAMVGMFSAYLIENLGGVQPQQFQFAFTFSFILSSCACLVFPTVRRSIFSERIPSRAKSSFRSFNPSSRHSF